MPYYEYHCPSNGRTVEVRHGMSERLESWGEVARVGGADLGPTPSDAPVERLMSAPVPLAGAARDTGFKGCGSGCACAPRA
jgi:hypothetical protein